MSILVYIGYMWASNWMPFSTVRHSVLTTHYSPLFWLTVLLCGGFAFCGDCLIEFIRITYYKSGSDYVREFVQKKRVEKPEGEIEVTQQDMAEIEEFMKDIREEYRKLD